ncbi:MAG: lipopolysaccharide biosynthesis protein [Microvirga sp.]|jgi:PST family polysaccharide transporter|nr:lipopolysaccharide biosynthesis protein [Microvirga sp.]
MSIRRNLISGSLWSIGASFTSLFSGFLVFSILAHLLQPAEFGIVAFAAVFIEIAATFMTAGIPEALIQREKWDETAASTAFWTSLVGSTLCAVVISAAGVWVILSGSSLLGAVIIALASGLIVDGARAVHEAKLRREFGYKVLALRTTTAKLSAGIVGVGLAYNGFGVWALVVNRLVAAILSAVIIWRAVPWRPRLVFSSGDLRQFGRFGGTLITAKMLGEITKRIPELAIGFVLGPVALASYRVGLRGLQFLISTTIRPLQVTALTALSRLQPAAVGEAYLRMTRATALISFPVFLGAAAIAPDFVVLCFGQKWASSASVMAALALVVAPATLVYFAAPALTAVGNTRLIVVSDIAQLLSSTLVVLIAVPFGIVAIAAGLTIRSHLTLPIVLLMLRKGVGLRVRRTATALIGPGVAASFMAIAVTAARLFVLEDMGPLVRLLASAVLGSVIYVGLLLAFAPRYTSETLLEFLPYLPPRLQRIGSRIVKRR